MQSPSQPSLESHFKSEEDSPKFMEEEITSNNDNFWIITDFFVTVNLFRRRQRRTRTRLQISQTERRMAENRNNTFPVVQSEWWLRVFLTLGILQQGHILEGLFVRKWSWKKHTVNVPLVSRISCNFSASYPICNYFVKLLSGSEQIRMAWDRPYFTINASQGANTHEAKGVPDSMRSPGCKKKWVGPLINFLCPNWGLPAVK